MKGPVRCSCKDWVENLMKLNEPWIIAIAHGSPGYTGKQFVYCPWCSKKLKRALR
jgi:hypothetical protein